VTKEVQEKHYPNNPIVTELSPAGTFYNAEDYHQFYLENNPEGYAVSLIKRSRQNNGFFPSFFFLIINLIFLL
jgi:peptide methionine sulfoxide reductase MsrA